MYTGLKPRLSSCTTKESLACNIIIESLELRLHMLLCVQGSVPFDNLADSAEKCGDVLGEMELNDVVQGTRIPLCLSMLDHHQCVHSYRYCGLSERQWLPCVVISRRPY